MAPLSDIEVQTALPVAGELLSCAVCGHARGFHRTPAGADGPCVHYDSLVRHPQCYCIQFRPFVEPALDSDPFANLMEPDDPHDDAPTLHPDDYPTPKPPVPAPPAPPERFPQGEPEQPAQSAAVASDGPQDAVREWPVIPRLAIEASDWVPVVSFPNPKADVAFADLSEPARRVAEIVEQLQSRLVPPTVARELERLVAEANALQIVDAASYAVGCVLYENLAANEKGLEETCEPVVAFFRRPWKALTTFRGRFADPADAAKKRLSQDCGAWKLEADRRAEADRRQREQLAQAEERRKLAEIAKVAEAQGQPDVAAMATQMAKEVTTPALPLRSSVPMGVPTSGRKTWAGVVTDEDLVYKGLADGTIPRAAAPLDPAWLNNQARALKGEMAKLYPGLEAREGGGLTASGRR